MKSKINRIH